MELVEADPDLTIDKVKSSCAYFYHLSVLNIPWAARKAMAFAFNYSYFIEVVRNGREYELHTPVPEGMEGYNPDLPGLPSYDLAYAREVMLESDEYGAACTTAGLTATSTDAEWEAVATGNTPLDTFNFTHYGLTTWYDQMADNFADIGIKIISDVVGDWPTFLAYTDAHIDELEITMGGWCPDYYDAVNMIQPLFGTDQSSNWNGLSNATIDANLNALHTLAGQAKLDAIDEVVTQIFVEQVAGMYIMQSAQYVLYNNKHCDPDTMGDLYSVRGDKYFYNVIFNEDALSGSGIPGYSLGIFALAVLGATALIIRKRK
jgi:ABC-type oligopeptide transport system substrate-binding subunit